MKRYSRSEFRRFAHPFRTVLYWTVSLVLMACGADDSGGSDNGGGEGIFVNEPNAVADTRLNAPDGLEKVIAPPSTAIACTMNSECATGHCVDGFCCDTPCSSTCMACSAAKKGSGVDGVCGSIAYDTDPDNECDAGGCSGSGSCQYYNGVACTATTDCLSSYCVDGFCCGNLCTGNCMACSAAKKGGGYDGVCGNIAAATDPDNECDPGECNGAGLCPQDEAANGAACTTDATCTSGSCVDGVCCDTACSGTCQACTAAKKGSGADGTCGNINYDADPDNECYLGSCSGTGTCQQYNGLSCTSTADCLSNYCVDGFCCGNECTGSCMACSAAKKGGGDDGVCGAIADTTDPDNECNPGECNGSGACNQSQAILDNGAACTSAAQCSSGSCVDGVCCDTACSGTCQACTAAKKGSGADGTCGNIGYDADPDNECYLGSCSGTGTCQQYNGLSCTSTADCLSNYCVDGFCCGNECTGSCMACSAAKKGSGYDGMCGLIANTTDPDNECNPGECDGSGSCNQAPASQANGTACVVAADCASGSCVDGFCCDTACTGLCQACSATKKGSGADGTCGNINYDADPDNECYLGSCSGTGTCQQYNGLSCTSTADCLSNYCVDGFCCGNECTGSCMACSAAKKGSGYDGVCGAIATDTDPDDECELACNGSGACVQASNGLVTPDLNKDGTSAMITANFTDAAKIDYPTGANNGSNNVSVLLNLTCHP